MSCGSLGRHSFPSVVQLVFRLDFVVCRCAELCDAVDLCTSSSHCTVQVVVTDGPSATMGYKWASMNVHSEQLSGQAIGPK